MSTVTSRSALRDWPAEDHALSGRIRLACFKRHHPDPMPQSSLLEELLFGGRIESIPRRLDADRPMIGVSTRNRGSVWPAVDKAHADRAHASGAMTGAGEAPLLRARSNGMRAFLTDAVALIAPYDLLTALDDGQHNLFRGALARSIRVAD